MIVRAFSVFFVIVSLIVPAAAQERVTVATMRLTANGALFLAAAKGFFKAEGLDLAMTAYPTEQAAAEAVAAGTSDFGVMGFSPAAFNLAGKGAIKAIAAQAREKRAYEGNEIMVSAAAYERGVRKFEDLAGTIVAIGTPGSSFHYQFGQIARIKSFDFNGLIVRAMPSLDAMANAVGSGQVDAAIVPAQYARELLLGNQARLVGWYSDLDEQQLGALFVNSKVIETRRATVEKFLSAYRGGAAAYASALLRIDRYSKRISDAKSQEAAAAISHYVYPGKTGGAAMVELGAYYMDPRARLDIADLERQIAWYKAQNLIDQGVEAANVVDASFVK